jgi:energy-coupling factor transporter ATP-binding protein EcfA2
MKSRVYRLEIRNFKAFREAFILDLEGRHLLVYGSNGSGKSSLYWALYTFLQSAHKPTPSVAKYFDAADPQNLLNIHEQVDPNPRAGEIALTLREIATKNDTTYRISQTTHGTRQQPAILKGDLARDFITYRFFFGFSHFRNSEKFNVWPLFAKEILPFCVSTGGIDPWERWKSIRSGIPNPAAYKGRAGRNAYDSFIADRNAFAGILPGIVDTISNQAQKFYDDHFSNDDPTKVTLKLGVTQHVERLRQIKLIDEVLACTDRVLNPAAHAGTPPLYEKEVGLNQADGKLTHTLEISRFHQRIPPTQTA